MMSDKVKDHITIFHDYGIYSPTRIVEITGEIDEEQYTKTLKNLLLLDLTNKPITIIINSIGGCVTQGKAIYDIMRSCQSEIIAHVCGEASSAASVILQAADFRYCTPNSKIMIHVGEEAIENNHPRNVDALYNEFREDEAWIENIYLKKIKEKKKRFTKNQVKSLLQFDKYIKPEKALEFNLIDGIKKL